MINDPHNIPVLSNDEWTAQLKASLPSANIPTLLMTLIHLTGDRKWLTERYQCSRVRGIDDNDPGGLPEEVQKEIRDAAFEALVEWKKNGTVKLRAPGFETLVEMLKLNVGEDIPQSYGPMISSWLGFDEDMVIDQKGRFKIPDGFKVVVIGAGVAGLASAIRLQGAGIPFVVVEKNAEVGGTWYENHYPGCGVDTPNHIYSYSFTKGDWSKYFALQEEIQKYFEGVADKFNLRQYIRFNTKVEAARYDEATMTWVVDTKNKDGETDRLIANVLLSAVGLLNVPKMPQIPGLDKFKGVCFHSTQWPEGLDLKGKRVGVIGNGATSMQIVPEISQIEGIQLTVFQRSKQWAAPFEKFRLEVPQEKRFLLSQLPFYQEWYRQRLAYIFNDRIHKSLQIDPQWPHPERSINRTNERHREHFVAYIKAELGDRQDLLPDVTPDYPPFGKRMLMDNGWFRTMAKANVRLVTGGIPEIRGNAVIDEKGNAHELDVLIVCTGFDAINMLASFNLVGKGGRSIREVWADNGAEAYLGVAAPGFPNFFMLAGPNTALGHGGSVVALMETQVAYVMNILRQAMDKTPEGQRFEFDVLKDCHDNYNARVQAAHGKMIWTHKGMSNWYRNAAGRVIATTPWRNDDYWHMARKADFDDYVFRTESAGLRGADHD
ncbi:flavin-containing monooxygenase [Paraburkholderia diazotrophica]|uniref:flavin-containing monooxygenase n=1 Tax=Paraburkholderia diazotrophica TaxID=667676 RepID=UPI00317BF086